MKRVLIASFLLLSLVRTPLTITAANSSNDIEEITFFLEYGDSPVYVSNPNIKVNYVYK